MASDGGSIIAATVADSDRVLALRGSVLYGNYSSWKKEKYSQIYE